MKQQLIFSLKQVAEALGCTVAAVRRWRREGRISVVKVGRLVRVSGNEVDRIAKHGLRSAAPRRPR